MGYDMARKGQISWVAMVDRFYQARNSYFPNMRDDQKVAQIRSYQRVLAEKMDARRITEAEWAYLLTKEWAEIDAREAIAEESRRPNIIYGPTPAPRYNCEKFGSGYNCNPF